jgi:hypothetical protein
MRSGCIYLLITAAIVSVVGSSSLAQETNSVSVSAQPMLLRWKFKPGDQIHYHVVDEMTLTASGAPIGRTSAPTRQELDIEWSVKSVDRTGDAVIEQKVSNVRMSIVGPKGERVEYSSAAEDPSASLAAMVAPIYDALKAGTFEFTMTTRGEIKDVNAPEKLLEVLKNTPGTPSTSGLTTADGLQRMIMQWLPTLPQTAVKPGDEWRSRSDLQGTDDEVVEAIYRFEGTREVDGRKLAVLRPDLRVTVSGNAGPHTKVKDQNANGEILFDGEAGRLQSVDWQRSVVLDVTAAGQTVEQRIEQEVAAKLMRP